MPVFSADIHLIVKAGPDTQHLLGYVPGVGQSVVSQTSLGEAQPGSGTPLQSCFPKPVRSGIRTPLKKPCTADVLRISGNAGQLGSFPPRDLLSPKPGVHPVSSGVCARLLHQPEDAPVMGARTPKTRRDDPRIPRGYRQESQGGPGRVGVVTRPSLLRLRKLS